MSYLGDNLRDGVQRVVLFGATGFIGLNILKAIMKSSGYEVVAVSRVNSPNRDKLFKLGAKVAFADITCYDSLRNIILPGDIIVHSAGYVGTKRNLLKKINVEGTLNLIKVCFEKRVKRFVYLSSISVLTGNKFLPLRDDMPLCASMPYGESKLEAEKVVWRAVNSGLNSVILRPAMVYGRDEPHILPIIFWLMRRRLFFLLGKADNLWHLCGIDNLVKVVTMAISRRDMLNEAFIVADKDVLMAEEIFNLLSLSISAPRPPRLSDKMVYVLERFPGLNKWIRFMKKERVYDISKLCSVGYEEAVGVKEGLLACGV